MSLSGSSHFLIFLRTMLFCGLFFIAPVDHALGFGGAPVGRDPVADRSDRDASRFTGSGFQRQSQYTAPSYSNMSRRQDIGGGRFRNDGRMGTGRVQLKTPICEAASIRLSSGFGMRNHPIHRYRKMHAGDDYAAPTGTPVVASAAGRVQDAGVEGGYGKLVRVQHSQGTNGVRTVYAHLSSIVVSKGQWVDEGQLLGYVGTTGVSTGPHLHYEVRIGNKPAQKGRPVDPQKYAGRSYSIAGMREPCERKNRIRNGSSWRGRQ